MHVMSLRAGFKAYATLFMLLQQNQLQESLLSDFHHKLRY